MSEGRGPEGDLEGGELLNQALIGPRDGAALADGGEGLAQREAVQAH